MASEIADTIVIGAGVIGLAIARQLALSGREVLLLEVNSSIGMETSSRNSGVIHAGIYYPPNSLKALCCVRGNQLLHDYCKKKHVSHSRCGKLIIASNEDQLDSLKALQNNAINSGVKNLAWLDQARVRDLEPQVRAVAGLLSPSTGVVDVHELMLALLADMETAGGTLIKHCKVLGGGTSGKRLELRVDNGGEYSFTAATVINAAGHGAADIAGKISGLPARNIPKVYPVRGHYYEHTGKLPFSRLIYPLPGNTGLGIHATIDLGGQGRFGPDAEYNDTVDLRFDDSRKPKFVEAIRSWYPELDESRLQPGFVGVRPKLQGPGEDFADFVISKPADHGLNGLTNLFGIDSPGLTACLTLARILDQEVVL
jgi:L-2-hydroxyglutarate oxidase LhgO